MSALALVLLHLALSPAAQDDARDWRAEAAAARELPLPVLTDADVARWRALVLPAADELAFEGLPWIDTFAGGLRAAERERKPLLFWAMNGHPLGCT